MTKKEKTILNMSLVPLIIIIGLILGAGYLLLQGEIKLPKFNKGPQLRRLEGYPTIVYNDKDLSKQRVVLKSQDELNNFLNSVDTSGLLTLKGNIDFNKEYLIAVTTDTQPETGHTIKIKKIYEDKANKTLLISIEESQMADNCVTDKDKNVAVDMVAISKTDWKLSFDRVKKTTECPTEESTDTTATVTPTPTATPAAK
jgi:hypothetical protein